MSNLEHIAFSFVHGGFDPDNVGGCSCDDCSQLREEIAAIREREGSRVFEWPSEEGNLDHQT